MRILLLPCVLATAILSLVGCQAGANSEEAEVALSDMNILFICVEDWSAEAIGAYGNEVVQTPHVDRLAAKGVQFDRAYCQAPVCNPSRASFATGYRPDTTRVYGNGDFMDEHVPEGIEMFSDVLQQRDDVEIVTIGKLVHRWGDAFRFIDGFDAVYYSHKYDKPDEDFAGKSDLIVDYGDAELVYKNFPDKEVVARLQKLYDEREARKAAGEPDTWELRKPFQQLMAEMVGDSGMAPEDMEDGRITLKARELLKNYAESGQQFLLNVGYYAPHTPLLAPREYVEKYPPEEMELSPAPHSKDQGVPEVARRFGRNYDIFNGMYPEYAPTPERQREAISAYYACSTYIDDQIGILLDTLDELGLSENTAVVFFSDHGFHLGEHDLWSKFTLFEQSSRVPLVIYLPGAEGNGQVCDEIVELVDFAPTVYEMWEVPSPDDLEGHSWLPLLEDPKQPWKEAAYSMIGIRGLGRGVRTKDFRYAEWRRTTDPDLSATPPLEVELYDLVNDPYEHINLAGNPEYTEVEARHRNLLHAGWQAAAPK